MTTLKAHMALGGGTVCGTTRAVSTVKDWNAATCGNCIRLRPTEAVVKAATPRKASKPSTTSKASTMPVESAQARAVSPFPWKTAVVAASVAAVFIAALFAPSGQQLPTPEALPMIEGARVETTNPAPAPAIVPMSANACNADAYAAGSECAASIAAVCATCTPRELITTTVAETAPIVTMDTSKAAPTPEASTYVYRPLPNLDHVQKIETSKATTSKASTATTTKASTATTSKASTATTSKAATSKASKACTAPMIKVEDGSCVPASFYEKTDYRPVPAVSKARTWDYFTEGGIAKARILATGKVITLPKGMGEDTAYTWLRSKGFLK